MIKHNIIFFVGEDFSLELLKFIPDTVNITHNILIFLAQENQKSSQIIELCIKKQLKYYLVSYDEAEWLKTLKILQSELDIDSILLLWWPKILSKNAIESSGISIFNIHPAPLPVGRGKSPNFWSVYYQLPYGATLHRIDTEIDKGNNIYKFSRPYEFPMTGGDVYEAQCELCLELLILFIDNFNQITLGEFYLHDQPLEPYEYNQSLKISYSNNFKKMLYFENFDDHKQFIYHILAKQFPPYQGLLISHNENLYEISVDVKKVDS